jgi:hypothetical protein
MLELQIANCKLQIGKLRRVIQMRELQIANRKMQIGKPRRMFL